MSKTKLKKRHECEYCSERVGRQTFHTGPVVSCSSCGRCKRWCTGTSLVNGRRFVNSCHRRPGTQVSKPLVPTTANKLLNPLPRRLGLEVEIGDWKTFTPRNLKQSSGTMMRDGSVQPSAHELVLEPLYGRQYVLGVTELAQQLHIHHATVNHTCGFHVHVDATDLDWFSLRRLTKIYLDLESELYRCLVDPSRLANRFCCPVDKDFRKEAAALWTFHKQSEIRRGLFYMVYGVDPKTHGQFTKEQIDSRVKQAITEAVDFVPSTPRLRNVRDPITGEYRAVLVQPPPVAKPDPKALRRLFVDQASKGLRNTFKQLKHNKYGEIGNRAHLIRYFGLNLHSLFFRGTVEFRMKEGVTDLESLMLWPLFCGWLVEGASRASDSDVLKYPATLVEFSQRWMPPAIAEWVLKKVTSAPTQTVTPPNEGAVGTGPLPHYTDIVYGAQLRRDLEGRAQQTAAANAAQQQAAQHFGGLRNMTGGLFREPIWVTHPLAEPAPIADDPTIDF
jgi:hypothetical protein